MYCRARSGLLLGQMCILTGDLVLLGNGYCRSEAAVVALLTKRSFAKRVYATVINAGNNTDGFKEQGELLGLVEVTGSPHS